MTRNMVDLKGKSGRLTAENCWDLLVIYYPVVLKDRISKRRYNLIMLLRSIWIKVTQTSITFADLHSIKQKCTQYVMEYEELVLKSLA